MESVLLLNASFEPLRIISWQRAISMCFMGKVEVIEEYDHQIRSVSLAIKAPAVVRLLRYVRLGQRKPALSRANLLARDNFHCQYCGISMTSKESTLDHVIPRIQNGGSTWENMVAACASCNREKGGRTPSQAGMKLLKKPIQPSWLPVLQIRLKGNIPETWGIFLRSWKTNSRS